MKARAANGAWEADSIVHGVLEAFVTAAGVIGIAADEEELAASRGGAWVVGRPHPCKGQIAEQNEEDHRDDERFGERARFLVWKAAQERRVQRLCSGEGTGKAIGREPHIGIGEEQVRALGVLTHAPAGVLLAVPAGGERDAGDEFDAGVRRGEAGDDRARAIGALIVVDENLKIGVSLREQRSDDRFDVAFFVASGDAVGEEGGGGEEVPKFRSS